MLLNPADDTHQSRPAKLSRVLGSSAASQEDQTQLTDCGVLLAPLPWPRRLATMGSPGIFVGEESLALVRLSPRFCAVELRN